jgi:hypothetical protein
MKINKEVKFKTDYKELYLKLRQRYIDLKIKYDYQQRLIDKIKA